MKTNIEIGKVPPQAQDLEQTVIGAILIDKNALEQVIGDLNRHLFYNENHAIIFDCIKSLFSQNKPVDILTLVNALKATTQIDQVGGAFYISTLTNRIASTSNLDQYVLILKEKLMKRRMIDLGSEMIKTAYAEDSDALQIQAQFENDINLIGDFNMDSGDVTHIERSVKEASKIYEARAFAFDKGVVDGISTGLEKLNRHTGGWQRGHLIIVAARPGMGKTAFVLESTKQAAKANRPVLFFSIEMTQEELIERLIIKESNGSINSANIREGSLTNREIVSKMQFESDLSKLPIHLSDRTQSVGSIRRKAKKWAVENKDGLIVVDYLQIMNADSDEQKGGNREQEVSKMSRGLKQLAKALKVPVIALSQLNRDCEKRPDKRPQLGDLRESGAIEQDADEVIMLYRPEHYDIKQDEEGNSTEGVCEVIIAKNRHGSRGMAKIYTNKQLSNFYDSYEQLQSANIQFNEPIKSSVRPSIDFYNTEKDEQPF